VPRRTIVYIDGFNLYYGALKSGPHKWLNLERYFRFLLPHDDLQRIRYFTAMVDGPTAAHQRVYLQALATLPLVDVILGRFKTKKIRCRVDPTICAVPHAQRLFGAPEEKRTDVNIAVHILDDAYQGACDRFVIVSGDSDLVPAVVAVKHRFPAKEVVVYVPSRDPVRGAAVELRTSADRARTLPLNFLAHAQFPNVIPDGAGGALTKPTDWL